MDNNKTLYTLAKHVTLAGIAGLSLASGNLSAWAADGLLHNIRFDQSSRHFLIDTTGPVKAMVNTLTIAGRKRVIIDLDNADIGGDLPRDAQLLEDLTPQLPGLKNVTVNQYGGNGRPIVRVLLDLQGDPGAIRLIRNQGPHIEIELSDYAASSPTTNYNSQPSQPSRNSDYPPLPDNTPQQPRSSYNPPSWQTSTRTTPSQTSSDSSGLTASVSATQMEQMKRTLVNMNHQYDLLLQENQNLKGKISTSRGSTSNQAELNLMKGQLDNLTLRNNELKTELQSLNSRNSEMQNRLTQALSADTGPRVEEMKRNLADLSRQNEQLKQERMQQSLQLEQTRQDKLQQSQQVQLLALDKASLTQQMAQLRTELANKTATPSASVSQPSVSNTELQELRRQLSVAQQSMNDSLRTIKEQNQEVAYLRNQVNTVKAGMDDAAKEQIASLQTANEQKDAALIALRRQLSTTLSTNTSSSSSANAQVTALKSQLDSMSRQHQSEIQELNRQIQQKNTQIQGLSQQVTLATTRQNDPVNNLELQKRENRITELQQALFKANQQVSDKQATQQELATTKAKLAQYLDNQTELNETQRELAAAKSQIAQLQADTSQLVATRQDLTALKAELDRIKSKHTHGNPAADNQQKETIARLNRENQQLTQQVQQITGQLKIAQQQAATPKATVENTAQTSQLQTQVASLQQELSTTKRQAELFNQEANRAKEELKALQQTKGKSTPAVANSTGNAALQKQLNDVNQQLSNLRRENDDLRTNLASKSNATSKGVVANTDAEAAYQEGKTLLEAKKLPDALDKFKQSLLLDPNNGRYTLDYSVALSEDQQYAEAIDVLRRYLQHNPLDRDAYNQLGKIYLLNDQADAANQSFVRAIPISTLNNYATSLKKLGKMSDAENVFKLALSLNPKDSEVLFNLGNLYNNQNKLELARNKYLEAIQIRPDFAEAHYNLGLIFSKLGDNPKAVTHLEKFLQLSPNARNAETIRAYVQKLKA